MFGSGSAQHLSRFGSSPNMPIQAASSEADGHMEVASASWSKKKSSLLKGLKKIGTLLSGHPVSGSATGGIRPDSDPSRNGLAHALSTPDMPAPIPVSMSASPSPLYMEIGRGQRLGTVLRSGVVGSPPTEPHSPSSPFPIDGRPFMNQSSSKNFSSHSTQSEDDSFRCHVHACGTPPAALPILLTSQPRAPCSPVAIASPLASTFSPYNSGSSGSGRLVNMGDCSPQSCQPSLVATPATASPSTPLTPSLSAEIVTASAAASVLPLPPLPAPATTLLALNPALPGAMRRQWWGLDDYQVVKRLYKGGSASVYKATCLRSGATVALKVYFLTRVPRNVVHMIKREVELHHRLVHPNIIQLYAAFLDGDRIVLVQEYAARGDLFHLLKQMGGRMTEAQVSEVVMRPFLEAMTYLHSQGVCHRDIKPENILYNDQWVLKVADFGVSINLNEERAVTRAGTIDYMAPEVSRCPLKAEPCDNKDDASLAYTSAVDIWAAGVLAYELLVGFTPVLGSPQGASRPIPAPNTEIGRFLATQATARALHFPSSLSSPARLFILGALADNPGDRPTAKEMQKHPWLMSTAAAVAAAVAAGPVTAAPAPPA